MARNVVNSRLFSARNFILTEIMQFRSSPLLVAAKRCSEIPSVFRYISPSAAPMMREALRDFVHHRLDEIPAPEQARRGTSSSRGTVVRHFHRKILEKIF